MGLFLLISSSPSISAEDEEVAAAHDDCSILSGENQGRERVAEVGPPRRACPDGSKPLGLGPLGRLRPPGLALSASADSEGITAQRNR